MTLKVFGSMGRGDGREDRDVDLLVTLAPGTSALALGGLLMDAQHLLGRRVDVVIEASLHPALRERVLAEACHFDTGARSRPGVAGTYARALGTHPRVHRWRTLLFRGFAPDTGRGGSQPANPGRIRSSHDRATGQTGLRRGRCRAHKPHHQTSAPPPPERSSVWSRQQLTFSDQAPTESASLE